jgi:hypothetical protein
MDFSPLVRPRHISISVRPIQNFFMSAVDVEVKLNRSFWFVIRSAHVQTLSTVFPSQLASVKRYSTRPYSLHCAWEILKSTEKDDRCAPDPSVP